MVRFRFHSYMKTYGLIQHSMLGPNAPLMDEVLGAVYIDEL